MKRPEGRRAEGWSITEVHEFTPETWSRLTAPLTEPCPDCGTVRMADGFCSCGDGPRRSTPHPLDDDERLGGALHAAVHPAHPWSGCSNPDLVYEWCKRFRAVFTVPES